MAGINRALSPRPPETRLIQFLQLDRSNVASSRLPLPSFSPRAVLMYSAAVGGEGAVALQLREARPGERGAAPRSVTHTHTHTHTHTVLLMYSAAVGGEGAVALQLREARPGERGAAPRFNEERLAIACSEPELLADLLHAAADIGGEQDGLSSLLGGRSPDAAASDLSDGLSTPDHDHGEYHRRPFCTHRR
ncbi:unnamed protein product [Plutella xylostella]|uniref:(diamondback moth) hypothetical protein n=1 Tax=Plutella xylostella TaxID=51655 RepID=A0A8S4FXH3_PLUXY|nr:unnamed protein product [Plutella xylostella]